MVIPLTLATCASNGYYIYGCYSCRFPLSLSVHLFIKHGGIREED